MGLAEDFIAEKGDAAGRRAVNMKTFLSGQDMVLQAVRDIRTRLRNLESATETKPRVRRQAPTRPMGENNEE